MIQKYNSTQFKMYERNLLNKLISTGTGWTALSWFLKQDRS